MRTVYRTLLEHQNVQEYVCNSYRHANVFACFKIDTRFQKIHVARPRLRIEPDLLYITSDSVP